MEGYVALLDHVCLRIVLVVGIICIAIDCSLVCLLRIKELERHFEGALIVICHTAAELLAVLLALTCYHDILTRLGKQILRLDPIDIHILDELECIHELSIMLRKVCCHLER